MIRFKILRAVLVALLLAVPVLAPAQQATVSQITLGDSATTDAEIAVRLREILAELGGYEDVTVSVNEGVLTLRGTTASLADVEALNDLAERVDGVIAVKNEVVETTDIARRLNPAIARFQARFNHPAHSPSQKTNGSSSRDTCLG